MASAPGLTNLSWENGIPTLYIAQGTKINVNLKDYVYDYDGNAVTIKVNSKSLPSGLTSSLDGIISGTTTSSTLGSLGITLKDSTNLTSTYTIKVKTVNPSLISSDESNLIHVLGAIDGKFSKVKTTDSKTFFELNEYDGGFSQISIATKGKVTVKDYYDDGNLTADSTESFTLTDSIGSDSILDTVTSTWAVENFTYGEARAVTSINGISTPGLYKVDVTATIKTPGTVEKSTDWWESGYSYNGKDITSLSTLQTMLTTTKTNVWMEGDKQVKLLANGKVVSTVKDGSLNTWNDDGTYEYNKVATATPIGSWTNSNGYLKITLTTGEVSAFKISNGSLMQTSLPAKGSSEIMTWYYGNGVTVSNFNTKYQLIADSKNTINATGTALADKILGNSVANLLDGKAGIDTLIGGLGDDTYIVDNTSDKVTELASQGIDLVKSSATYVLSANVENLTLIGSSVINGTGNALNNIITGNSVANVLDGGLGNDILDGGAGADTMKGGLGSDVYYIDNISDKIIETTSSSISQSGTDTVNSSITYVLQNDLENLTLLGTANINGTGNYQNNILIGNSGKNILDGGKGNDTLNGGAGADTMKGGSGNDIYYVDNIGDIVIETTASYTDTVNSSISYKLTSYVSDLNLIGTSVINGIGNELNNKITGNGASNTLTGGAGADDFIFNTKLGNTNIDKITDFVRAYDEMRLENSIFTKLTTLGTLNTANFVSNGTKALDNDDYIIYNKTNGQLFYDADGSGAGASILFATLENKSDLKNTDFFVI